MNFHKLTNSTTPFYEEVLTSCKRIIATDGTCAEAAMEPSAYVLQGNTFRIKTKKGIFSFWLGVNGPRLFFITHLKNIDPKNARDIFSFCFGGAEKVGWEMNFEPLDKGVSIWGTCMTDRALRLTEKDEKSYSHASNEYMFQLTEYGLFWATDIAMMAQSWVRTSERNNVECHEMEPAPL